MWEEKRDGLSIVWFGFSARFETVRVDEDCGEKERGEFGRDGVGCVLCEKGGDEGRTTSGGNGDDTRIGGVLVQPFVLVVVDDGYDASFRGRGRELAPEAVVVDECEFIGREGGEIVEAEKVFRGIDTGLGERVEILCAEDEVGAVGLD